MNDLVNVIKNCDLSTYDNDTQIFAAETEPGKLQEMADIVAAVDRWYDANGRKRNHSKYQRLYGHGNLQTPKPKFLCDNTTIPVSEDLTLLRVTIHN